MKRPEEPQSGEVYLNVDDDKVYQHDGQKWNPVESDNKNSFDYRGIYNLGSWVFTWTAVVDGHPLSGSSSSVRKVYREAKREVKRHRKMMKFLNEE